MRIPLYGYLALGIFLALFVISPIISILFFIIVTYLISNPKNYVFDITLCCLFILLIQSTRTFDIHNDFIAYKNAFERVEGLDLLTYIKTYMQPDFAWYILNYISYYLLGGSFKVFSEFIVVSTYLLIFIGLYLYWKKTETPYACFFTSIVILTFFPTVLTVSNNLLRQQFALSVMIFALIAHKCENLKTWPLAIFALFCHTMTIVFVPLYFLNFDFVLKGRRLIGVLLAATLFSLVVSYASMFSMFSGIYVYDRLVTGSKITNTDVINPSVVYSYGLIMLIFFVKSVYIDKVRNSTILYVQNLSFALVVFCLVTSSLPMFVTRYYISRVFIMPFILPYFINNRYWSRIYLGCIAAFFMLLFFVTPPQYIDTKLFSLIRIPVWNFTLI